MVFPETSDIQLLQKKLAKMDQYAPGYLYSVTRRINTNTFPEHQAEVQTELDQIVGLYTVLHGMKLLKTFLPVTQWDHVCAHHITGEGNPAIPPEKLERLRAYHYVRVVAAHGLDGRRRDESGKALRTHLDEFNRVMASGSPLTAIEATEAVVTVDPACIRDFHGLLRDVANLALQHSVHCEDRE